jgi:hypothetical protein
VKEYAADGVTEIRQTLTDYNLSQAYLDRSISYDQLSRITSETRGFTGIGNFTISYQYNLANDLSSLTGPSPLSLVVRPVGGSAFASCLRAGQSALTVNYTRDSSGRLTTITRHGQTLASGIS